MKTTLDRIYWPLMDAQTVKLPYCAVCGRNRPLNEHHLVWRSWGELIGVDGKPMEKPTVTLCGFGSNLGSNGGAEFCHGKAHHRMIHFRNDRGRLEFIELDEPKNYIDALNESGWTPLITEERWSDSIA